MAVNARIICVQYQRRKISIDEKKKVLLVSASGFDAILYKPELIRSYDFQGEANTVNSCANDLFLSGRKEINKKNLLYYQSLNCEKFG
jgi:hypothetical protein